MKYTGSKNNIAKYILPIMLKDRNGKNWVEPFVGGANMIDKVDGYRFGYDNNEYLICLLNHVKNGGFIEKREISKEEWYHVKENKDLYPKWYVGLIGVLASYNGNWFSAYGGGSKTKEGNYRNYFDEGIRGLIKQDLTGIDFVFSDYKNIDFKELSIIYCDPPYAGTTKYKDDFDHDKFWQWCREKCEDGHRVFVSEYNAPDDFVCVWSGELSVTVQKSGTKKATERLFVHKSQA